MWPLLLAMAQARGTEPAPAAAHGVSRDAGLGWQLRGPWDSAAQELFALFKPLLDAPRGGPAWVIAQLGQSLDACVATRSGDSCFVNGPETLAHLHRLRALSDAVIVGAGTVACDNPRLTTRHVSGPHPTRVLLDPTLRLAGLVGTAHVFTDEQVPTLWLCDATRRDQAVALLGAPRVLAVGGLLAEGGVLQLALAVAALHARGLSRLFVEGGGVTVSRFLAQGCLDRLHLAIAPLLIGDGRPGLRFAGATRLADCARPRCSVYRMGRDQLWDLDLRAPA
ncbi:RibD family protein [Aquabacterium sp.]|uniref:RibD family protein n=1 Tax=Aquabacterium sp. TaxID=1872578 RepID=UPI002C7F9D76|nr:RibD family protein [Aquabacterium sp.]HSW06478.1 RibD family protein [Aquabacterium sp.]